MYLRINFFLTPFIRLTPRGIFTNILQTAFHAQISKVQKWQSSHQLFLRLWYLCIGEIDLRFFFHFSAQTLTAIETWLVTCIGFLFFSLIELGIVMQAVTLLDRDELKKRRRKKFSITNALFNRMRGKEVHLGSISPNFVRQVKSRRRTAFSKKILLNFTNKFDKIFHIIMPDLWAKICSTVAKSVHCSPLAKYHFAKKKLLILVSQTNIGEIGPRKLPRGRNSIEQAGATYGPRAKCGLLKLLIW